MKLFTLTPEQILLIAQALEFTRHQSQYSENAADQQKMFALEVQLRASLKEGF